MNNFSDRMFLPNQVGILAIVLISLSTLFSYIIGEWKLLSFGSNYIPMAPLTAILFLALSGSLYLQLKEERTDSQMLIIQTISALIFFICIFSIFQGMVPIIPNIEENIIPIPDQVEGINVGNMSLLTAVLFIITCLSISCGVSKKREYRNVSPILAIIVLSTGLVIIQGYWYNTPLLYGGTIVPVALSTGFCFLLLGIVLIYLRKDDTSFGVAFFGDSVKAKILRTFLPVMVLFVLINGWIYSLFVFHPSFWNPILWTGVIAVLLMGIIVAITTILSRQIGGVIDRAESERDRSDRELLSAHEKLTTAYSQLEIQEKRLLQNLGEIATREEELRSQNDDLVNRQLALEISETRYFELFDHISSGVVVYESVNQGEDFIIRDVNRASEKIEQIPRTDLIGKRILDVFPGALEYGLLEVLKEVWMSGIPRHFPASFYQDNRISGWRENYIYKLPSGEVVAVYDDVTERKTSEEALKKSEEKFRIVANFTYDWETWESPSGEFIYISPSCERITGYLPEEFMERKVSFTQIVHPDDLSLWENHDNDAKTTNELFSLEFRIIRRNGEVRWIHHVCKPIIIPSGQNLGRRGSNRDVTLEKEYQDALQKRDAQYKLISENSADVIWLLDLRTNQLKYVSPSVFKMLGYTPEEFMKQTIEYLLTPESYASISTQLPIRISRLNKGDESQRVQTFEVYQFHKNGTIIPSEVVITLITGETGEVEEILGVSRDIRERKTAEHKNKVAITQINQNLETLAVLNDQIRNPLMVIELIADSVGGESYENIHEQILIIDELIKQVDIGFIKSEKVRSFLIKHYDISFKPDGQDTSDVHKE